MGIEAFLHPLHGSRQDGITLPSQPCLKRLKLPLALGVWVFEYGERVEDLMDESVPMPFLSLGCWGPVSKR